MPISYSMTARHDNMHYKQLPDDDCEDCPPPMPQTKPPIEIKAIPPPVQLVPLPPPPPPRTDFAVLVQRQTNYTVMEALRTKLATFIEAENIDALKPLVEQLRAADVATTIVVVKQYLCPRVNGLRNLIQDQLDAAKVTLPVGKIDKCARFLEAMCEVAER